MGALSAPTPPERANEDVVGRATHAGPGAFRLCSQVLLFCHRDQAVCWRVSRPPRRAAHGCFAERDDFVSIVNSDFVCVVATTSPRDPILSELATPGGMGYPFF